MSSLQSAVGSIQLAVGGIQLAVFSWQLSLIHISAAILHELPDHKSAASYLRGLTDKFELCMKKTDKMCIRDSLQTIEIVMYPSMVRRYNVRSD